MRYQIRLNGELHAEFDDCESALDFLLEQPPEHLESWAVKRGDEVLMSVKPIRDARFIEEEHRPETCGLAVQHALDAGYWLTEWREGGAVYTMSKREYD